LFARCEAECRKVDSKIEGWEQSRGRLDVYYMTATKRGKRRLLMKTPGSQVYSPVARGNKKEGAGMVPGLYSRNCADNFQQFGTKGYQGERNKCSNKTILSAFVFGSTTAQNCALCHQALGTHFPTFRSATISRFPCNFFAEWPLKFFLSARFAK